MNKRVVVRNTDDNKDTYIEIDKHPDMCPICHNKITPKQIVGFLLHRYNEAQIIYKCPSEECHRCFIADYMQEIGPHSTYYFSSTSPWRFDKQEFRATIKEVSTSFCNIYNEALEAETRRLTQICGAGYRKALEFLIKDYLIIAKKEPKETISKVKLGECINKYIQNEHIKKCASRAAWLGNDETHYYRKWENKDLQDLKTLIQLTVNFIDSDLLASKYEKEMPT
jgi:hypothetical protein